MQPLSQRSDLTITFAIELARRGLATTIVIAVVALLAAPGSGFAQTAGGRLTPLTQNDSFEAGTQGWNGDNSVASVLFRRFIPDISLPSSAELGDRFMELAVQGSFSQWVWIDPSKRHHIVSIQADRTGSGWAGFGVTYLDEVGDIVGVFEKEIKQSAESAAPGQNIKPYSMGMLVPVDAAFAVIWVSNSDSDSKVYFDEFGLYEYKEPNRNNLMAVGSYMQRITSNPAFFSGTEFFLPGLEGSENGIKPSFFTTGGFKGTPFTTRPGIAFGQPDAETVAYQPLRLDAGAQYSLIFYSYSNPQAVSVMGIDFYDVDGNRIGKEDVVLPAGVPNPFGSAPRLNFEVPAGTASSTYWIYVTPTELPTRFGTLSLERR